MIRFERKPTPALFSAIALTMTAVFIADYFIPEGVAVWIVYLIPVVLTFLTVRPALPFAIAGLASVLMVVGYIVSPPGVYALFAKINRGFGLVTIWVIALIGYRFILNKLAVQREEWLQNGHMGLSAKLAGDQTVPQIGGNALRYLAEYLQAFAGTFFVADNGLLKRVAEYAIRAEALPAQLAPGEGLVGQAVKDQRTMVINDVPQEYFTIASSLGKTRPRHLVIVPVILDGAVEAVFELGFLHDVFGSDSELLHRVRESIGVAVRSAKYRSELQDLLEETRRQAEELQAQSEELRVSNEELGEQSRALKESHARLEQQQTELEQTNAQLEQQTQLLELQKDEMTRAKDILESQARDLEQASRYKSDFLANMSHELRTPLNSSLVLAKLLADNREGNLTPEQVKYAQTIQSAGNDLLSLITDILDLSKIEAGRMELKTEIIPVQRLVENLTRTLHPMATHKGLQIRMQVSPGTPETLETDAQRLEQVLRNLLSNAIKFTDKGEVALEIGSVAGGDGGPGPAKTGWEPQIAFAVRDTGIGISREQQQIIFEPFQQGDATTSRKYGGTGLGLSISRELVRLLGGKISVSSEVGRGSTFTVTVPQRYCSSLLRSHSDATASAMYQRPLVAAVSQSLMQGGRTRQAQSSLKARVSDDRERLTASTRVILVVEDDETFARILSDLAHELGFQCLIATTAEEGLVLAMQFTPSAVLLDVALPDNSGLAVLDRLKSDARTRHIPVHVVSAGDHAQTALSLGAVGYMIKPVSREQLASAFQQLESRLTQRLRRVLIVEDDAVQLDSLRKLLGSGDVETIGVRSAAECLQVLKNTTVDCMVLDLTLPDASGFSLLATLSKEDTYSFPPVIVYTGRELTGAEEERLRKYSKSIIIKGAKSPERLLDEVTLFLHQVVSTLPPEQRKLLDKAWSRDAVLEGKRILIAEDDVRNVFAVTSIFEPRGAKVLIARNGREALDVLTRCAGDGGQSVNMVLMDIMMPEMDGLTCIREIRKRPEWQRIPIIALTAKAMKNDQEQCLNAGANDYMAKPLDVEKLLSLVHVWMPR